MARSSLTYILGFSVKFFFQSIYTRPIHQSLVAIFPVVSEEKIKMGNVDGWTTDEK
jgi:hypothetical protein